MSGSRSLLITVTEATPAARENLEELLASLAGQGSNGDVVLVVRGGSVAPPAPPAHRVHPVPAPRRLGLSQARNIGLAHAEALGLLEAANLVAFPDDDARYPGRLLARGHAHLAAGHDFVCGPYGPDALNVDHGRFPRAPADVTPRLIMRAGSSCTLFLSGVAARKLGQFDERFGLGGRYGSSEDADYLLRALGGGLRGIYDPSMLVEHPYKGGRPVEYYRGNVAVLAKHAVGGGTLFLLARRLLSGVLLTIRRRLSAPQLAGAIGSAARLLVNR